MGFQGRGGSAHGVFRAGVDQQMEFSGQRGSENAATVARKTAPDKKRRRRKRPAAKKMQKMLKNTYTPVYDCPTPKKHGNDEIVNRE
jgi:hypothetical protein